MLLVHKYADINTEDYGWDSSLQQQNASRFALSMSSSSSAATKTIEDTILVAHSMGNLLIAGALANGLCKLGSTSNWVAISGPMTGSMGSDYLQSSCASQGAGYLQVCQLLHQQVLRDQVERRGHGLPPRRIAAGRHQEAGQVARVLALSTEPSESEEKESMFLEVDATL